MENTAYLLGRLYLFLGGKVQMESINKTKSIVIIPVVLCVGLLMSLGVNVWLYNQLISFNQGVMVTQTQQASIQSEYDDLSIKIADGKQRLSAKQKDNSQMDQDIPAEAITQQQVKPAEQTQTSKPVQASQPSQSTQPQTSNNDDKIGVAGAFSKTSWDTDGNGIKDSLESTTGNIGGTTSNPNFHLTTD